MSKYFPINLNIEKKRCIVIGAGRVAERKVKRLLAYGGEVILVSPDLTEGLRKLVHTGRVEYLRKKYSPGVIKNAFLVFAATSDRRVNHQIASKAEKLGILVNVADSLKESIFILPAIYKKKNVTISVSTNGKSPSLAKKIRNQLGKLV